MSTRLGPYVPLSANYADDDAILAITPMAELLFLRALAFAKRLPNDGYLTTAQVERCAYKLPKLDKLVAELVTNSLWTPVDGGYVIKSWLKWNLSNEQLGRTRAKDRQRKAAASTPDGDAESEPHPARNPARVAAESGTPPPRNPPDSAEESAHPSAQAGALARRPDPTRQDLTGTDLTQEAAGVVDVAHEGERARLQADDDAEDRSAEPPTPPGAQAVPAPEQPPDAPVDNPPARAHPAPRDLPRAPAPQRLPAVPDHPAELPPGAAAEIDRIRQSLEAGAAVGGTSWALAEHVADGYDRLVAARDAQGAYGLLAAWACQAEDRSLRQADLDGSRRLVQAFGRLAVEALDQSLNGSAKDDLWPYAFAVARKLAKGGAA